MKKQFVGVIGLFLFSIVFRLWFISLAVQPPYYDQDEYERYAGKMLTHHFVASHTYRTYPYPLFVAGIYSFVGFGNRHSVFLVQAILDSLTGVCVYIILLRCFKKKSLALLGFTLYAINPFTSGYVGLLLSEIVETFLMTFTIVCGILFLDNKTWQRALLLGLVAGLTAETRNASFLWIVIPIGLLALWSTKKRRLVLGAAIGTFLTVVYPLYTNWTAYHEINITTVDSFYAKEFFNGAIMKVLPPFTYIYPPEVNRMFGEYYSEYFPWRTSVDRKAMADKYFAMGWDIIKRDPIDYIKARFFKMWYVWQKENVFFYSEPGFEKHWFLTYYGNLIILAFAVIGLVFWYRDRMKALVSRWVLWSTIGSFAYATFAFSLTHAEYRLTIPFYPLLIIAMTYGIKNMAKQKFIVSRFT